MNDLMETHEGPEMDALRELRAEVPGPSHAQRQAAWERAQGARSQVRGSRWRGSRPWLVGAVAAVGAGVLAVGLGASVLGPDDSAPAQSSTPAAPTNPNRTPYATGSVWEPEGPADKKTIDTYRAEHIHLLPDGGVRIDIPEEMDWFAMTRALNAEGVPIRFWAVDGQKGEWDTAPARPVDGETGVGSEDGAGPRYPREKVVETRAGGPGSALTALTFPEVPTEPVDITLTQ